MHGGRPLRKALRSNHFFVSDITGRVLVVPLGAELILPDERTSRSNWLGELPTTTIAGLNRLGISTERWMGSKTLRCRESFILPEEQVYVLGTAHEDIDGRERAENSARLYIGSSRDHEFIISDRSEKDLVVPIAMAGVGFRGRRPDTCCNLFDHHLQVLPDSTYT